MDTKSQIEEAIRYSGSQAKLADAIGMSQSSISRVCSGERGLTVEKALMIQFATDGHIKAFDLRPDILGRFKSIA